MIGPDTPESLARDLLCAFMDTEDWPTAASAARIRPEEWPAVREALIRLANPPAAFPARGVDESPAIG